MTPDPAVQRIVFWILVFLIGVHVMVLVILVGLRAVQPWASRAVVILLGVPRQYCVRAKSFDAGAIVWRFYA